MIEAALARMGMVSTQGRSIAYGALSLAVLLTAWLLSTSVFQLIAPRVLPSPAEVAQK